MPQPEPKADSPDTDICHVCQVARDCGLGFSGKRNEPIKWLCAECSLIIEDIRRIKRMDAYELQALTAVDAIAGDYAAQHGTDIAQYDELTRRMLWKAIVQGYGRELRKGIRDGVPF